MDGIEYRDAIDSSPDIMDWKQQVARRSACRIMSTRIGTTAIDTLDSVMYAMAYVYRHMYSRTR